MYLLRHGATDYNLRKPPVLQGRSVDLGLNEVGLGQARAAADFLAQTRLTAVYASPLKRAIETAGYVAERHGLSVVPCPPLAEVDVGRWENRSWIDIAETDPELYRLFQDDPGRHGYAGGENLSQVEARVRPELQRIAALHLGQSIAVVGHNVVNRAFLSGVLGLPMSNARRVYQDNGCVNVLHFTGREIAARTINVIPSEPR